MYRGMKKPDGGTACLLRNTRNYWHSVVSHLSFMMFPVSLCGKALEFRRGWAYFALMYSIWCTSFRESPRTWRSTLDWPIMGLALFHYVAFAVSTGFRCSSCAPLIVIHWFWQAKKHIQYRTAIWQLLDCTKWIKITHGLEFSKSGLEVLHHYSEYKSWVHEA